MARYRKTGAGVRSALIDYFGRIRDRIPFLAPTPARVSGSHAALGLWKQVFDTISMALAAEEERWFAWFVVAFGSGIAIYFGLAHEPLPSNATAVAILGAACL